jgi:hypothetical protein
MANPTNNPAGRRYRRAVASLDGLRNAFIAAVLVAGLVQWLSGLPVLAGTIFWVVLALGATLRLRRRGRLSS